MWRVCLGEEDGRLGYIRKEYLEMHHFYIELVKDGEAAIQAFNRLPIDVCILDIMLPKKDGFAVAAEIRKLNERMPLIFLTAKSLKIDKLKGFNLGADDYMVKPVDEEELIARINAVMRRVIPQENGGVSQYQLGKYTFDFANQVLILDDKKQFITVRE